VKRRARDPDAPRSIGQSMVEFALVFPIFIVLLIGLVEGGRYVFYAESLNHAAREGARYAIIHGGNSSAPTGPPHDPTGAAVQQAVRDAAVGFGDPDAIEFPVGPTWSPLNNDRGSNVTVTVEYTYMPVVPVFGAITVEAEATLVINN
jgi:Flp pilus assembly protein TadG